MKPLRPDLHNIIPYIHMVCSTDMDIYAYMRHKLNSDRIFIGREKQHIENSLYEKIIQSTHTRNR